MGGFRVIGLTENGSGVLTNVDNPVVLDILVKAGLNKKVETIEGVPTVVFTDKNSPNAKFGLQKDKSWLGKEELEDSAKQMEGEGSEGDIGDGSNEGDEDGMDAEGSIEDGDGLEDDIDADDADDAGDTSEVSENSIFSASRDAITQYSQFLSKVL